MPKSGDIRLADPMDLESISPRPVLIIDVDNERKFVSCVLASSDVEFATDRDLRLPADETGLPYSLVVETDVVGPLWFAQLGPALARLPLQTVELVRKPGRLLEIPIGTTWGFPARDQFDSRWKWKQAEISVMHALASTCIEQLTAEDEYVWIDPVLLHPQRESAGPWKATERIAALIDLADRERLYLHERVAASLQSLPTSEAQSRIGVDAWNVLEFICGRAHFRESLRINMPPGKTEWQPGRTGDPFLGSIVEGLVLDEVSRRRRSINLATAPEVWSASEEWVKQGVIIVSLGEGARVQVVPRIVGGVA
jgi:hypothetical protein